MSAKTKSRPRTSTAKAQFPEKKQMFKTIQKKKEKRMSKKRRRETFPKGSEGGVKTHRDSISGKNSSSQKQVKLTRSASKQTHYQDLKRSSLNFE